MHTFIRNLRLGHKFVVLGLVAAVMAGIPLVIQVRSLNQEVAVLEGEIAGLEPGRGLLRVVQLTQQHRGMSASVLAGNADFEAQRAAKQLELRQAVAAFDTLVKRDVDNARVRADWQRAAADWQTLVAAVAGRVISADESSRRHTALIGSQIELHDRLADHFGLTLDPEAGSYFAVIATLQQMPRVTEALGQVRALGTLALAKKELSPPQRATIAEITGRARTGLRELGLTLEKAFEADPRVKDALDGTFEQSRTKVDGLLKLARDNILDAKEYTYPSTDFFNATTAAIDGVFATNVAAGKALEQILTGRLSKARQTQAGMLAGVAALLAFGLWLGAAIARSIVGQARAAQAVAERIAAGDLTSDINVTSNDEIGRMLQAMQTMQSSLAQVVGNVRGNADGVATASAQIAQGNQDLSQRTEEQASALQQTAASMEQLGSTVKQNADNARQANQLAQGACTVAVKGGEVVGQVVETMKGINDSSRKIADIISVIDGIAFQTNILALNAAVEAARAGEQGRGFAVVASEVRSLAQRSGAAAKEIKTLIGVSVERVEQGTALVGQAGATMTEIVASIRRVTDIMGEISAASIEQSTGVAQVGESVSQMDQATQQNAALVEESAVAADSLKSQAQQLVQAVAVFKITHSGSEPFAAAVNHRVAGHPGKGPSGKHPRLKFTGKAKMSPPQAAPSRAKLAPAPVEEAWSSH